MNISVGIVGENPGWDMLLGQEGIPYAHVRDDIDPGKYSAVVAGDGSDRQSIDRVRSYLEAGGGVLCSGSMAPELTHRSSTARQVRFICGQDDAIFSHLELTDVEWKCHIPADANCVITNDGAPAVFVGPYGGGTLVALPFDAGSMMRDARAARRSFYAERSRLPFERISCVSKRGVRRLVSRSLEILHHRRRLPFLHLCYYPSGAPTIFAFRVDTDYATEREIRSLQDLTTEQRIPVSWFVHVKAHEEYCDLFKRTNGDEIGVHCYDHAVSHDGDAIRNDIRRAIDVLQSAGISPAGYAAPYGLWNEAMASAVASFSFEYSSEFSYDYDNLPSRPIIGSGYSSVMQIPIHPISIGSLRRQGFTATEMIDYFRRAIERKIMAHDPLIFYHHPKNSCHDVLKELFRMIRQHNIPTMTMCDVATWWKRRERIELTIRLNNSHVEMTPSPQDRDVYLHITRNDDTESMVQCGASIDLDRLQWTRIQRPLSLPDDVVRIRAFNPWIPINLVEDAITRLIRARR